jgi:hypothetical protein
VGQYLFYSVIKLSRAKSHRHCFIVCLYVTQKWPPVRFGSLPHILWFEAKITNPRSRQQLRAGASLSPSSRTWTARRPQAQAKERAGRVYSNHLVDIPLRYWQAQGDSRYEVRPGFSTLPVGNGGLARLAAVTWWWRCMR